MEALLILLGLGTALGARAMFENWSMRSMCVKCKHMRVVHGEEAYDCLFKGCPCKEFV